MPLSRQVFDVAYDEVADQLADSAPPGLSRQQFDDLVIQEIERREKSGELSDPSLLMRAGTMAVRIAPTIAGGFMGSLGGPLGTVAGGAAGAALGEYAAEQIERSTRQRRDLNPTQIATQAALGAIPLGTMAPGLRVGQIVARRALQGAGMGALSTEATELAESGEFAGVDQLLGGAVLGGVVGGGLGRLEGALRPRARPGVVAPPREQRALPPGRFIGTPEGTVQAPGQTIDMMPGPTGSFEATPEGPRVTRAAVLDRELDPGTPVKDAPVRQYSGDPAAVDTQVVTDAERAMLERMRADIEAFPGNESGMVAGGRSGRAGDDDFFSRGGAGSPVLNDIRVLSGSKESGAAFVEAIDDVLAGKPLTNKNHVAALDAARGYIEGRQGYRGPVLPEDWSGGGTPASAADDFARFADDVDEMSGKVRPSEREPGEAGFANPLLLARVAGGLGGAAYGGATGDTPQERLERAALYGIAGAAAPSLPSLFRAARGRAPGVIARGAAEANLPRRPVRMGGPIDDVMKGMQPFLDKFSPETQGGIEKLLVDNGGFAEQRRGVISRQQLDEFASEVKVRTDKVLPKGTSLPPEAVTAYARALQRAQQKVEQLSAKVNAGTALDTDIVALQAAKAETDVLGQSLLGARAEAGRSLSAFNFYNDIINTGDVKKVTQAARAMREEAQRIAEGLAAQPDDPLARFRWLQAQGENTWGDTARSFYYANILSGPKTHARNLIGNLSNITSELVTQPVAAGIDAARSKVTGAPRTIYASELPGTLRATGKGIREGLGEAAQTWKQGVSPRTLTRTLEAGAEGKLDLPRREFRGGLKNPLNIPGRALDASDAFFRSVARQQELYGLAHAKATGEGLTGQAFDRRVAALRNGTAADAPALAEQAEAYATRAVFQEKPTKFAQAIQGVIRQKPALSYVLPFVKTPANIARQGLEFSPAGFLMQAAKQGGRTGAQAQARATMGTAAAGVLAYMASEGLISGDGPKDQAERARLMESGWRPNSIKMGDHWYSYQLFQPIATQASLIANGFEAWREGGGKGEDLPEIAGRIMQKSANSFLDQSFMSGLFDVVESLKEGSLSRAGARAASGLIPAVGLQRSAAQAIDPVMRDPKTFVERLTADLPGLSQTLEPRIARSGQPVMRQGGPVRRGLDPLNTSDVTHDPVAEELGRLGIAVSPPSGEVSDVMQSGPTGTAVKQQRGQALWTALGRVMADPRYAQLSDEAKARVLERVKDRVARQSGKAVKRIPGVLTKPSTGPAARAR